MDLENVLLAVSVVATAIPIIKLIRTFLTEVRSSKLVVTDHDGKVMGEISTERLQHTDLQELSVWGAGPKRQGRRASSRLRKIPHINQKRTTATFSKLSGGGVGTFVVWLANHLNWSDDWKTIAYGSAPWIALFVSWLGPIATAFTVNLGSYVRAKIFLREIDRLSNSDPTMRTSRRRRARLVDDCRAFDQLDEKELAGVEAAKQGRVGTQPRKA